SATHASATSSGVPERCIGAVARTEARIASQSAVHGVSISPGATALTRISGPSTLASRTVRWLSAAFDTAYGIEEPTGRTPASDVTLMMTPSPLARRYGTAVWITFQVPSTLTARIRSQISVVAASRS